MPYISVTIIDPDKNEYGAEVDSNADAQSLLSSVLRRINRANDGKEYELLLHGLRLEEGSEIEIREKKAYDPLRRMEKK